MSRIFARLLIRRFSMAGCAGEGGCPSDYVAVAISFLSLILLLYRSILPFVIHKFSRTKGSGFWIPVLQVFASFNLILSIVMSVDLLKFERRHWWQSCYVWAVWIEGPLGFGLLLSCRIVQAFQLYFIFAKRRLPPMRSHVCLPLFLLPWFAGAAFIHVKQPLNYHCHMGAQWVIPVVSFHMLYVATLVAFTGAIRHIEFRFNELRDLWRGIVLSASSIGVWIAAYVLNEIHEEIAWLQVVSRFLLLVTSSILVLAFFSISSSQPLLSQISLRRREPLKYETMGQALGIPDSGLLMQREPSQAIDPDEPLDKLLLNKGFRQSFMAFADSPEGAKGVSRLIDSQILGQTREVLKSFQASIFPHYRLKGTKGVAHLPMLACSCLAGESVHFHDDVHELGKIPVNDSVRRIYMARDIIDKYITAGAPMEVNISYRCRQDILMTSNLAHPDLFNNALNELLQLMKMNLAKDYWSSTFFLKFKEEVSMRSDAHEMEPMTGWNFSPRLSGVRSADDPFHQEYLTKDSDHGSRNTDAT